MTQSVLERLPARSGHFLLESGLHTDLWLTLDALFLNPRAVAPLVSELAARLSRYDPTAVCGPLVGGAFLAQAVATELGVDFYYTEPSTPQADGGLFTTEYRLPAQLRHAIRDARVALVDDVISAGSSVRATAIALKNEDAHLVAIGTFMLFGVVARDYFASAGIPLETLEQRDLAMWLPEECPLCKTGVPLVRPW